jgi:hypothetical protein
LAPWERRLSFSWWRCSHGESPCSFDEDSTACSGPDAQRAMDGESRQKGLDRSKGNLHEPFAKAYGLQAQATGSEQREQGISCPVHVHTCRRCEGVVIVNVWMLLQEIFYVLVCMHRASSRIPSLPSTTPYSVLHSPFPIPHSPFPISHHPPRHLSSVIRHPSSVILPIPIPILSTEEYSAPGGFWGYLPFLPPPS